MRWVQLAQNGDAPPARSSHTLCSVGGRGTEHLVMFAGEYGPRQPTSSHTYIYDLATHTWTSIAPSSGETPSERLAAAAASINNTIYVHGGRSEVSEGSALDDLHAFDVETAKWLRLNPKSSSSSGSTLPPARNYHAATSGADGAFYIFGGCGKAGRLADLWRYDPREGAWQEMPRSDAILGRGGAGFVATADDALWVIGGFIGKESGDVHRFDLKTNTWEEIETTWVDPKARFTPRSVFGRATHACGGGGGSCVAGHGGHITLFGGEIDPSDQGHAGAGQFTSQVICLDPVGNAVAEGQSNKSNKREWHALEVSGESPCQRGWMASCSVSAGMIVSGGINEANERLGDLWLLDVHAAA